MNTQAYINRQRKGLLAGTMAQTMVAISSLSLAPLAILLQTDYGLSRAELGIMLSAGSMGALISALPAGWLSDLLGVRWVVAAALVVAGLTFAVVGLTHSFVLGLALLFISGLGTGVISPATTKAILYWFPARFRGTAMGIKQTGYALGGALAAAILPSLALALGGWRPAVLAVGIVATVMAGAYFLLYSEHPQQTFGSVGQQARFSVLRLVSSDPRILSLSALAFCYGYTQSTFMSYLSLYLQETVGASIVTAGALLMLGQISGAFGRVGWGVVSDRFFGGRRTPVMLVVTGACGVLALVFGPLLPVLPDWGRLALIVAFGLVAVGWSGLYHVFVGEMAGREKAGTAVGLCLMVCAGGSVLGPPVFGFIVDVSQSYPVAWASQSLLSFIGVALIVRLRRDSDFGRAASAAQ